MDTDGSGDHDQLQAAAGQAAGGGPHPSEMASASAMASSLPPPAPWATDVAVRTRARVSEDPTPPPASAAAATTFGIENPPSDDEESLTPAQIDAIAAAHEEMEVTIQKSLKQTQSEDAPLPLSQIAALADKERGDDETDGNKKAAPTTEADKGSPPRSTATLREQQIPIRPNMNAASLQRTCERVRRQQEEILQQVQDPPTPAVARAPPLVDQGRSPSNPRSQQQIPIRPTPQSMRPSPDDDTDPSISALLHDPSIFRLRATLVEDQPEIPVYDAIQIAEQTRFEKNKKLIIGLGTGLLIGAMAVGVSISLNNGSSGSNTVEPEGVVLSTARPSESSSPSEIPSLPSTTHPSESFSPSDVPSLRPTLGPSQSLAPSTSLRPTTSLRPSQTPSIHPSSMPTATPPVYCGEIDILADEFFDETSWNLVRFETIGGTIYTEIIIEGSPEEEHHHTSYKTCLESGDYEFAIFDSYGDGIDSSGYYSVAFDGVMIAQGGDFESEEKISFSLPLPSPPPSESFPPSELPSASFQPSESTVPSQSLSPSFRPSNSLSPSTYWSSLSWSRQDLGFNGDASDAFFGRAVAFSADALTMAIGAPGSLDNDYRLGYVKVYHREGESSSWEQRGETILGEANGDHFGISLSLSEDGTALSIGAPLHDSVGSDSGQVKVYEWDEAALDYVQIGDTLYGAASDDNFGWSLDILNGKILAVGAPYYGDNGSNLGQVISGQVKIYAWDEASSNFKQRGGAINGDTALDWFGRSVSLAEKGQKLAVGASGNDSNGRQSGQVRVFEWDEAASTYEQSGDSLLGDASGDRLGRSVSFSRDGTTLAIGAPGNSENGRSSGQVKVFAWDEAASNLYQIGQSLYGKAAYDEFGISVSLSSEGKTLAVGASQPFTNKPGYVEVYEWDEAASEYKRLGQSLGGEASRDAFGEGLALAGNGRVLAAGAKRNDRNGTDSGRVEVFDNELRFSNAPLGA